MSLRDLLKGAGDGVYCVRTGNKHEKVIQIPFKCSGEYRRYVEDDGNIIVLVKV